MWLIDFIRRHRPSIRSVLLIATLGLFGLTISGVLFLTYKYYESELLIQRTEENITNQAVFISSIYIASFKRRLTQNSAVALTNYGKPVEVERKDKNTRWQPLIPKLVTRDLLPSAPSPVKTVEPDQIAIQVGEEMEPLLREAQKTTLSGIRVLDFNGVVVASTGTEHGAALTNRHDVNEALLGRVTSQLRVRKSEDQPLYSGFSLTALLAYLKGAPLSISRSSFYRVYVNFPIVLESRLLGVVTISRTPLNFYELVHRHISTFLIWLILGISVAVSLSLFISFKLTEPVRAITDRANRSRVGRRGAFKEFFRRPLAAEHKQLYDSVSEMVNTLEEQKSRLEEQATRTQHFANHVVHEIDNQLVSIRGAVELIKNDFGTMADYERYQFLSTIENNVASLSNLVDELHKQARNDRATLTERYYVDIPKVLDNIGKHNPSHQPDISISTTIGVVHLGVSDVVLESIIKSLVDNAKKVGGQNVRISIDATISDEQSNTFRVIVSDNGPGILEKHRENIFADFFTTDREKVGGGLGLSNIKNILEVHSGRIELLTSLEGASFLIELPVIG